MNPAPAHLEAKLRFGWDFTVGQIAAMIGGILVGFAWANWLSPIHGIGAAVTGVYVGGLPVAAGFVASQTEFDLWAVVLSSARWRRARESLHRGRRPGGGIRGPRRRGPSRPCTFARHAGHGGAVGRQLKSEGFRAAGELLGVEAIDRTGLVVTSEGAFVRIVRVMPVNPLLMSGEEREKTAATFQRLISQLQSDERIQLVVEGRPVNLDELLSECRREVEACAGPAPSRETPSRDPLALSRWRLHAALEESLRLHADSQAAVEVNHYLVIPLLPRQHVARAALAYWRRGKLPTAPLERTLTAHRRAVREHLGRIDALRAELEADGMPTELLDGEQVAHLLWASFNTTKADRGRRPVQLGELLGELDAPVEREEAIEAGARLKEAIAASSLDFDRDSQLAYVDRDACQTIAVATTAGRTTMGWLHSAMLTRQPFCLCVYVHALERRRERQRLKLAYRRLFTINRGAESRGRVPDFDRYVQEHEYEGLLGELATGQQTGLFHVSIYEQLRARGPDPDLAALAEAVDFCTEQIESAADCKTNAGSFRQQQLWESVLPLGRDVAAQVRKYPTVNAADMLPLVGTTCGSPTGVPFAFADPGRTVELLNLYDEQHPNHTLLIAGRSGSGKTMTANVLISRCLAAGARAFVIDRAGHYQTLSRLIEGAQQIEIGAEGSPYALNPWDVPDARQSAAREGRVSDRAAPGDDGPP